MGIRDQKGYTTEHAAKRRQKEVLQAIGSTNFHLGRFERDNCTTVLIHESYCAFIELFELCFMNALVPISAFGAVFGVIGELHPLTGDKERVEEMFARLKSLLIKEENRLKAIINGEFEGDE